MKLKIWPLLLLFFLSSGAPVLSQAGRPRELRKAYVAPEEIISMSKTMPFNQALEIFNILSKKFLGKVIIDLQERTIPIGVDIDKMHWLDALELILRTNKLWYEEYAEYIKITSLVEEMAQPAEEKGKVKFDTREVMISAIFFEADASKLRQLGMSWDIFRGSDVNLGAHMSAAESKSGLVEIDINPELDFGNLLAVFKALESDQIGEVVASPQITVRSEEEGRIQVGSDIAVTIRDFAGNAITQFFSTGSIIKVRPEVIKQDTTYFILLDLNIERSNTATSSIGLEIKKSSAQTSVLLLDGEETILGGLYVNEESKSREGVPLLKNLPWWFFGLRYLFGFDARTVIKKELLILLKAELLPTLNERLREKLKQPGRRPILLEKRLKIQEQMKFYKNQSKPLK
ncbi:MAG: type II and III secretion system protein [candidate division KSB1 bacterium]|nr:type II and III secretion system protein [candidate division KSB1 bacterium]